MKPDRIIGWGIDRQTALDVIAAVWDLAPATLHLEWAPERDQYVLGLYDRSMHLWHFNWVRTPPIAAARRDANERWLAALQEALVLCLQGRFFHRAHRRGGYS